MARTSGHVQNLRGLRGSGSLETSRWFVCMAGKQGAHEGLWDSMVSM